MAVQFTHQQLPELLTQGQGHTDEATEGPMILLLLLIEDIPP